MATLRKIANMSGVSTVPYISVVRGDTIPADRKSTYEFLTQYSVTKAGINTSGNAEGIVIRTPDRGLIRKVRFEDYERTAKREKW